MTEKENTKKKITDNALNFMHLLRERDNCLNRAELESKEKQALLYALEHSALASIYRKISKSQIIRVYDVLTKGNITYLDVVYCKHLVRVHSFYNALGACQSMFVTGISKVK